MRMRGFAGRRGRRRRDGRRPGAALGLLAGLAALPAAHGADGDLRLADGVEPKSGRLEVYLDGAWGTVCDDYFGEPEAKVACRQLGYVNADRWVGAGLVFLDGDESTPIHMDDVDCDGSEARLVDCAHRRLSNCLHFEDLVLYCSDDVEVGVTVVSPWVHEGSPARFRLTRRASASALTVSVAVSETGGMIDGAPPTSVTFPAGVTARDLDIATEDDDIPEPDSAVTVRVVPGAGYQAGDAESATARVVDDDEASTAVRLWLSPTRVSEADGPTPVSVSAGLDGARRAVPTTVTVTVAGSVGPGAVDFAPVPDFTLTVAAGEAYGAGTFTLTPEDDAVAEHHETVTVSGAARDLDVTAATLALRDDEGTPRLTIEGSESFEDDPGPLDYVVTLAPASVSTVTVDYWTDANLRAAPPPAYRLAQAGEDFEPLRATLTFAPGETSRTVGVEVLPDLVDEPVEAVVVTLGNPVNALFEYRVSRDPQCWWDICGSLCCACGTILDDDPAELSIRDASASEGDSHMEFEVELGAPTDVPVSFSYATSDGTALAGEDYRAASGSLTIPAGLQRRTIRIRLDDDDRDEPDEESFTVTLTDPVGATLSREVGTGKIRDDDTAKFSVAGATAVEGAVLEFRVTLSTVRIRPATVYYETRDGTALAGEDYRAVSGTLTFAPDESGRIVPVALLDDDRDEPPETFGVVLLSPTNAGIARPDAYGTIIDDDDPPAMSVGAASGVEGDTLRFPVRLDAASAFAVEVDYETRDLAAVAGEDYGEISGTLTFAPGATARMLTVALLDDALDEPEETFAVTLWSSINANLALSAAEGTIIDDDEPPRVLIGAATGREGSSVAFWVGLGAASGREVTVAFATQDGTAVAGEDYEPVSGTLTFEPGVANRSVSVPLLDDDIDEPEETFAVVLSSATNATVDAARVTGRILDDDDPPAFSVADGSGVEGGVVVFDVDLRGESSRAATVAYATEDVTAVAGGDYEAVSGTLTFAPGVANQPVSVTLLDDDLDEPAESFAVVLSSATDATVDRARAAGTILDDDGAPQLSVRGASGPEGGTAAFAVTLAGSTSLAVTVSYATSDGTAVAGVDYRAASGTLTFAPGDASATVAVALLADGVDEPEETFALELASAANATLAVAGAAGVIEDADAPPALSVADARGAEGGTAAFAVTLAGSTSLAVTVAYATSDGTAVAGGDYVAASGALTFAPGDAAATVVVRLLADGVDEPEETFALQLSAAANATLAVASAAGAIGDADPPPALSVADARGAEGGAAAFAVTIAGSTSRAVTVGYATADGTAVAGVDYEAASGALTFAPGDAAATVSVALLADGVDEPEETFALRLSSPANATLAAAAAVGTIADADGRPVLSVAGGRGAEGGTAAFAVALAGSTDRRVTVAYATADGTAVAGVDYVAASGTLTLAPGETRRTLSVALLDDAADEPEERFALALSSPAHASLGTATATWTIVDDDPAAKAPTRGRVLLFEPAAHPVRQGFVRVINHTASSGEILVEAIDDAGARFGPVALALGAGAATHFNSDDLETGNAAKGLPAGVGPPGEGVWRLELSSELDVEVLSYARTADGFVTALHDTAPAAAGVHRAVFLNPGGNVDQVSRLRLVNPGAADAVVTIAGVDDAGAASGVVSVEVPAGASRERTAAQLESGAGVAGALGAGEGKWRLRLSSDRPVAVLSLIESPTGNLTNLSTLPRNAGRAAGSHAVPLFPSAADAAGRQGFVRVANRSPSAAAVRIEAFDRTAWAYAAVTLSVAAGGVASFNSDDLELGSTAKGLDGGTGAGDGDWWLELSGGGDLGVWSYVRTRDGFLTSMHDAAPATAAGVHRVVFFNPARNVDQVSVLWLVNPGDAAAAVAVTGVDDAGVSPGTAVRTTVPAGSSRRLTSAELETGVSAAVDDGALGEGVGKWRLRVESDRPIRVMSLLENPTGHLTNLSTAPGRGATDGPIP